VDNPAIFIRFGFTIPGYNRKDNADGDYYRKGANYGDVDTNQVGRN
jgi:hypothetical protein